MKVTVGPIVSGALGTVAIGLEIGGRIETIQTEYWKESWRPEETCCHVEPGKTSSANAGVKNLQGI